MYKGFLLVGVLSVMSVVGTAASDTSTGDTAATDTSNESFIQSCTSECLSQGMQFDSEKSLNPDGNTCVCVTAYDNAN